VNDVGPIFVLLAPLGLIYSWVFYFTRMRKEPAGWRSRATLLSLVLVSLAILLWPAVMVLTPGADWERGTGVGHQVQWVYARARVALGLSLAALVLSLFGRPRLILPITIACIGTGVLWLMSTMP
jgi:hypothetical protein